VPDGLESFFAVCDLLHSALTVKILDGRVNLSAGELLDRFFERGVLLADDLVQMCGSQSSMLQLVVGSPGSYSFVLPHVTYQQHPIFPAEPVKEFVDLAGAGKTGFVEHIKMFLAGRGLWLSGKVVLHRVRRNSGLSQLLGSA